MNQQLGDKCAFLFLILLTGDLGHVPCAERAHICLAVPKSQIEILDEDILCYSYHLFTIILNIFRFLKFVCNLLFFYLL